MNTELISKYRILRMSNDVVLMIVLFHLQGICSELALVDMVKDKLQGEAMDLLHGQAFMKRCTVNYDTGFKL